MSMHEALISGSPLKAAERGLKLLHTQLRQQPVQVGPAPEVMYLAPGCEG